MRTQTVLVTPAMAREMLQKNPRNRSLRRSNVRYLATELRSGRWRLTHQGVAVATDGTLLDGQHRLSAIIEADTSALINVSYDCDPELFTVIDTGSARTSADVLRTAGAVNRQEATTAATCKLVHLYRRAPNYTWTGEVSRISSAVVLAEHQRNPELYHWAVRLAQRARNEFLALRLKSATAAFAFIAAEDGRAIGLQQDDIEEFVMSVASGANLAKGDPRMTFRQQLINGWTPSSGARSSQLWLACWLRLFNQRWSGTQLKVFKTPAVMPMPKLML
jgi:hypothetical protein